MIYFLAGIAAALFMAVEFFAISKLPLSVGIIGEGTASILYIVALGLSWLFWLWIIHFWKPLD